VSGSRVLGSARAYAAQISQPRGRESGRGVCVCVRGGGARESERARERESERESAREREREGFRVEVVEAHGEVRGVFMS